jgi:mono/diheme cytochrome c family protein
MSRLTMKTNRHEGRNANGCVISRARISLAVVCFAFIFSRHAMLAQAGTGTPTFKKDVYAELSKAPKKAVERRNPLEQDPDAVVAGGKLYEMHCAECHGDLADGGKKGPSLRAPEVQQSTPGTLFWLLTNGVVRRGMPVWSKLPEPQRWQLVSYIKSLGPAPKPSASNSPDQKATKPGGAPSNRSGS